MFSFTIQQFVLKNSFSDAQDIYNFFVYSPAINIKTFKIPRNIYTVFRQFVLKNSFSINQDIRIYNVFMVYNPANRIK